MRPLSYASMIQPGFSRSRRQRRARLGFWLFVIGFFILVSGAVYVVTLFKIENIQIEGAHFTDPQYVEKIILEETHRSFASGNLFLFSKKQFMEALKPRIAVESLVFEKKLPHTLRVVLREYQPAAFWATSGFFQEPTEEIEGRISTTTEVGGMNVTQLFILDDKGVIRQEWIAPVIEDENFSAEDLPLLEQPKLLAEKSLASLPIIADISGTPSSVNDQVLFSGYRDVLAAYHGAFDDKPFPFRPLYYAFPDPADPNELRVMTDKGFWVYLAKDANWDQIAENLRASYAAKKIPEKNLSYIDLRLADRIFFK